ncbi:MAG: hypothetical protein JJT76_18440 [Clostridiaceae bacterium]|nr:hypothetical protein [Clostridiaceae bacterium]
MRDIGFKETATGKTIYQDGTNFYKTDVTASKYNVTSGVILYKRSMYIKGEGEESQDWMRLVR